LNEVEKLCRKLGIQIEISEDRRVNLNLKPVAASEHASVD
jgi:hypothetical protein